MKRSRITKDMPIAEILELYPDAVDMMLEVGLQCVGCSANTEESLEVGMLGHGFEEDEVESMVEAINRMFTEDEESSFAKAPDDKDFKLEILEEGNKKYYKLAGMMFSQKAYDALHELQSESKHALQIRVEAGGCSGYKNKYDFVEIAKDDEQTYKLSEDLNLFINDFTFEKLHDSIVDYESGLHGSGLKFINPNIKGSCGCGTSVAF